MKYFKGVLDGCLKMLGSAWNRETKASRTVHVRKPEAASSVDRDTHAQNRFNSFFYAALVPKLQPCWNRVQGKGEITFRYTYRVVGTNWVWQQQEVEGHTLPQEQAAIALQFMNEAARGTSFPMEAAEAARKENELVIHWTWPVPFPEDVTIMGLMIDKGGCKKEFVDCVCPFFPPPIGVVCRCEPTCYGYSSCTVDPDGKGCSMTRPLRVSGRIGGPRASS